MDTMGSITNEEIDDILEADKNNKGISLFLEKIELTKYYAIFKEQEIDLKLLLTLGDEDLQELGIKAFGPRRKIVNATLAIRSVVGNVFNTSK